MLLQHVAAGCLPLSHAVSLQTVTKLNGIMGCTGLAVRACML